MPLVKCELPSSETEYWVEKRPHKRFFFNLAEQMILYDPEWKYLWKPKNNGRVILGKMRSLELDLYINWEKDFRGKGFQMYPHPIGPRNFNNRHKRSMFSGKNGIFIAFPKKKKYPISIQFHAQLFSKACLYAP